MYRFFILLPLYLLIMPSPAYAYIDPGTGSLILQAIVAGGITALVYFRNIRRKILSFFRRAKDTEKND